MVCLGFETLITIQIPVIVDNMPITSHAFIQEIIVNKVFTFCYIIMLYIVVHNNIFIYCMFRVVIYLCPLLILSPSL